MNGEMVARVVRGSKVFMRFFKPKYHYWISESYRFADGVSMRVRNTAGVMGPVSHIQVEYRQ